ncbi:MAG: hypothetical protein IKA85_06725 [Clostridia bacterium]|nr:hypothetical protein [Clostridia bacterium]
MSKYTQNQFDALDEEKRKLLGGDYQSYLNIYNIMNPKQEETTPKASNPYDDYMKVATDTYNKSVEANNKASQNQALSANSEHNELQRNVNELNKASGKANTGYAGDASIEGFNAYRNALNQIYTQRDKTNNDLYSYYMDNMMKLQQQKREDAIIQESQQKEKEETVIKTINEFFENPDAYDVNNNVKDDYAQIVRDYVSEIYGSEEKIPPRVKVTLSSYPKYDEYLDAYNKGETPIDNSIKNTKNSLNAFNTNGDIVSANDSDAQQQFAVLNAGLASTSSHVRGGVGLDNFILMVDGKPYKVESGKLKDRLTGDVADKLKAQIKVVNGRDAKEGDCVYYNGEIYVVGNNGMLVKVEPREGVVTDYNNFKIAIYKKLGLNIEDEIKSRNEEFIGTINE